VQLTEAYDSGSSVFCLEPLVGSLACHCPGTGLWIKQGSVRESLRHLAQPGRRRDRGTTV